MADSKRQAPQAPPAARLLLGQVCAGFAQWLDIFLVFSIPSFVWKSSPGEIALVAALFGLPSLFLGPLFGAFLDRSDPRRLMVAGALLRAVLTASIAFAPGFGLFAALVLAKGLANLVYWPAGTVVTQLAVAEHQRLHYFASLSVWDQLCKVGAPLVGGLLMLAMPARQVFMVSVVATLVGLLVLLPMLQRLPLAPPATARTVRGLLQGLLQGWAAFGTLPGPLLLGMGLGVGLSTVLALYDPHVPAFLAAKGFDASAFALLVSATAAGAVAAALVVRSADGRWTPLALIRGGTTIFGSAVVATAVAVCLAPGRLDQTLLCLLWFANGFGYEVFVIGVGVNFQNLCPPALLGRVATSLRSLQMAAVVLGPGAGAWLIAGFGRPAPFVAAACATVVLLGVVVGFGRRG